MKRLAKVDLSARLSRKSINRRIPRGMLAYPFTATI